MECFVSLVTTAAKQMDRVSGPGRHDYGMPTHFVVPVDDISWVHVLGCFQQLVHDVALVYIFQNIPTLYHIVQIRVWSKEHSLDIIN